MMAVLVAAAIAFRSQLRALLALGKAAEARLPLPATLLHQRVR